MADQPWRRGGNHDRPNREWTVGRPATLRARWARWAVIAGVGDVDGVFRLADWSGDLLGWTPSELRHAPYGEWVHPDDRDVLVEHAERVVTSTVGGRYWPVEVRLLGRDRHYWWTRWCLWSPLDPPMVTAVGVDYVGGDGELGPPVGTWRWNIGTDTVVWSAELLDMFALAVGPPASYQTFLATVNVEDRAEVDRAVRWSVLSGDPYVADFRAAHRERGRERWFHAAGRVEAATGQQPERLLGIVKDLNP